MSVGAIVKRARKGRQRNGERAFDMERGGVCGVCGRDVVLKKREKRGGG